MSENTDQVNDENVVEDPQNDVAEPAESMTEADTPPSIDQEDETKLQTFTRQMQSLRSLISADDAAKSAVNTSRVGTASAEEEVRMANSHLTSMRQDESNTLDSRTETKKAARDGFTPVVEFLQSWQAEYN